jgi:hypothetical protein
MNELSDAPDTGGAEESAQVETNAEATTAQDTGTEETGQADDTGDATEEAPKRVPWFQKRIDEVTRQKYEEQRRADYLQGQIDALTKGRPAPQQQVETPPDRWEDPEGYDRWLINQAAEVAQRRTAEDMQRQQALRTFEERVQAARQVHPDYDAVTHDPSLPITPKMAEIIRKSDNGPEVAYYLGTNRSEAQRIAALDPDEQVAEMGALRASLRKQPAAQAQTRTPPAAPPRTVSGISAGLNKDPNEMSMAEYVAARKAGTI